MRRIATVAIALGFLVAAGASSASASRSVGPDQPFAASVGGAFDGATIDVACHGKATVGHPFGGQTLEVLSPPPPVAYGTVIHTGETGASATSILAVIPGQPGKVLARFTSYFQELPIPTSLKLPCSGTSRVRFVPTPASDTSVAAWVSISFHDAR